jgi:hypothetical protein
MFVMNDFSKASMEKHFKVYEEATGKPAKGFAVWLHNGREVPALKIEALPKHLLIWKQGEDLKDCVIVRYSEILGFEIKAEAQGRDFALE